MINPIRHIRKWKIRSKLAILILAAGMFCILLFRFLWNNRWNVWDFTAKHFPELAFDQPALLETLRTEAKKYDIPESEDDTEAIEALAPFFALTDEYTAIYLYGLEDGAFRAGKSPEIMDDPLFRTFFDPGYNITAGDGEDSMETSFEFKNGICNVIMAYYHRSRISYPWFVFSFLFSVLVFLSIILFFVNQKMKHIISLKDEILLMASGDLTHNIPDCGKDEIGILSRELDQLRLTLSDTILQEQESRRANQDLITALSHDLRTPLTILTGYLEVLKLKRNPDMQEEYLNRCLRKTSDIKEMTDRMFEYALVFEETEKPVLTSLSTDLPDTCLRENCDFIQLAGFEVQLTLAGISEVFLGDAAMLKRIFNNLFSNILKYGDKKETVIAAASIEKETYHVTLSNAVRQELSGVESNQIGLKSVEKMMKLLGGNILFTENQDEDPLDLHLSMPGSQKRFTVQLTFPLHRNK